MNIQALLNQPLEAFEKGSYGAANRKTHLLSVSKPTKSFFSKGTQSSGILSPDLSVARSSRLDSRTINIDSTKSSTLFSTSEQSSKLG